MNTQELIHRFPMTYSSEEMCYLLEKFIELKSGYKTTIRIPVDRIGCSMLQDAFCNAHDWLLSNNYVMDELGYYNFKN